MRVYRNSDGYIVTYTPSDVEAFYLKGYHQTMVTSLLAINGFFEFDRGGNLRGMDDHQPDGPALAAFAVHCWDFADKEAQSPAYEPQLTATRSVDERVKDLDGGHDIGGEG